LLLVLAVQQVPQAVQVVSLALALEEQCLLLVVLGAVVTQVVLVELLLGLLHLVLTVEKVALELATLARQPLHTLSHLQVAYLFGAEVMAEVAMVLVHRAMLDFA
jgi:hypothetical protein